MLINLKLTELLGVLLWRVKIDNNMFFCNKKSYNMIILIKKRNCIILCIKKVTDIFYY